MAIHSSILAWRIPWTEKPGGLQSTGSQRVGHDRVKHSPHTHSQKATVGIGSIFIIFLHSRCLGKRKEFSLDS